MLILAISTSTARGSVALLDDQTAVAARSYVDERRHAERLFDELDALLAQAGVGRHELGAIACDVGPGSFTGTRVGLASAKGIALGLGLPLWPASALRAMALAAFSQGASGDKIVPCVDAKRGEIFHATYRRDLTELQAPTQSRKPELLALLTSYAADDIVNSGQILGEAPPLPPAHVTGEGFGLPDAQWIGRLAHRDFSDKPPPPLALIEPIYVRSVDAVPNLPTPPVTIN